MSVQQVDKRINKSWTDLSHKFKRVLRSAAETMMAILRTIATVAVLVGAAEAFVPHHTRAMHAGHVRMGAEPQRMGEPFRSNRFT